MRCLACGVEYQERYDIVRLYSDFVGEYTVGPVVYLVCIGCKDIMLPGDAWKLADEKENNILQARINNFPVSDFISSTETAQMLGISRQALNKNIRIRNGFIYSARIGDHICYLKESVVAFKEKGDGRFSLAIKTTVDSQFLGCIISSSKDYVVKIQPQQPLNEKHISYVPGQPNFLDFPEFKGMSSVGFPPIRENFKQKTRRIQYAR